MSYPYGQPEYPPHGYPGYPQAGYPVYGYPGYPQPGYPMQRASGGAAITAGILAVLLCLVAVFGIITSVSLAAHADTDDLGLLYAVTGVEGLIAFVWLLGGIMLMNRKNAGRIILIILSSIGLLGGLAGTVAGLASPVPATAVPGIVGVLVALLMLTLTLVGSTKRWCEEGNLPPYPYY
ncbi:hypothetical protein [Nocardia sp. BMG51109]|uniref:hypothetical protein n=1 Tax=Nocardia sp. BMG51109 TaxID=1056816 RepID=UPI000464A654|nr:hypothetical protein [Nocardia sp. BMG51109]